jgi:signal recognition particle receptor subunit beta
MVDCSDDERFNEVQTEFNGLSASLNNSENRIPILVLGNKIDSNYAISEYQLTDLLNVQFKKHIKIFMCSVNLDTGYKEGLKWLVSQIKST